MQDTRGALLDAAVAQFAERGYEGARLRDVAAAADVDVALVSYHFGGKAGLFAAAMQLAVNPADVIEPVLAGGVEDLGPRLLRAFLGVWDDPARGGPFVALLRSAAANEEAADLLRGFVEQEVFGRIARTVDAPQPALRAGLLGTQIIGLALARYVVRVEPIASADAETLVAAIGPTLQRYLTGPVDA